MGKVFIFLYNDMNPGGIQTNMYNISRSMIANGIRVVWICSNRKISIYEGYRDIINKEKINIIHINELLKGQNIYFDKNDDVRMLCFSPISFLVLDKVKRKFNDCKISTYYLMPHFENKDYFPDRFFKINFIKATIKHFVKELFLSFDNNNLILFFEKVHCAKVEKYYGFKIKDIDNKLAKIAAIAPVIEFNKIEKKAKRDMFRIITISRFEFPHKGYLIGLISTFSKLKSKYDKLYLDIVGYGDDAKVVYDTISQLTEYVQNSITLHGYKPYEDLKDLFEASHLNIGVGGALLDGARHAVPSLPARHYSYSCEVYGFLPYSVDKLLSEEPGYDLERFINEAINMTDKEYIELCLKSTETDKLRGKSSNPLWIFDVKENFDVCLNKEQILLLIILKHRMKVNVLLQRIILLIKNPRMFFSKVKNRFIKN